MSIPFLPQQRHYTCGPATLRMALAALGIEYSEDHLRKLAGTTAQDGTPYQAMRKALRRLHQHYRSRSGNTLKSLQKALREGVVIADWAPQLHEPDHPEFQPSPEYDPAHDGHYTVIKKADANKVILHDPTLGPDYTLTWKEFQTAWKDLAHYRHRWLLVIKRPAKG